jgi:aquaporin Z
MRRYLAEGIGTFALVFTGCGAAAFGGAQLGAGGVAFAFGLALAAMLVALGPAMETAFNPAVTLALVASRRLPARELLPRCAAQLAGGVAAAGAVVAIARGRPGGAPLAAEAIANGYGRLSPGAYGLGAAAATEVVLTAVFALVVLGAGLGARGAGAGEAPRVQAGASFAAIAGAAYALVHLVGMPITGLSANPARSLGPAILAGGPALEQVWLFVAAPLAGGLLAAGAHRALHST